MLNCEVGWQFGVFIKSVARSSFEFAKDVPQSCLLNVSVLLALEYVLAKLRIIWESNSIPIGCRKYGRKARTRCSGCTHLGSNSEKHIVVILSCETAKRAANYVADYQAVELCFLFFRRVACFDDKDQWVSCTYVEDGELPRKRRQGAITILLYKFAICWCMAQQCL